jgi:hypothetical protein
MHVINKNCQNIIMETCFFCNKDFQHGNHIYDGEFIRSYDVIACKKCWDGNWDGWVGRNAERLIEHLKSKNIPVPERNEKGWIPRGN